jgi:hypothetical protein
MGLEMVLNKVFAILFVIDILFNGESGELGCQFANILTSKIH